MRILLTLFCILPLTIDTAFAAAQWTKDADFNTIKESLDKICSKTIPGTTIKKPVQEEDTTGGWCTPTINDNKIKITDVIGVCANSGNENKENISFSAGDNKRCYCRILQPYVSKYWYHLNLYDSQSACAQHCSDLCKNVAIDKEKITKIESITENQNSTFRESTPKTCNTKRKTIQKCTLYCPNNGCYIDNNSKKYIYHEDSEKYNEDYYYCDNALHNMKIDLNNYTNWISGECTITTTTQDKTTYYYYQTVSDDTGDYYCIQDSSKKPTDYNNMCQEQE